jgi:tetratricopeptide (TPR) repeat protein
VTTLVTALLGVSNSAAQAQEVSGDWQGELRRYADAHDWADALLVVDRQIALSPNDMDIRAWRARVLTWSGKLSDAELEYREILAVERNDPDNWMGLATVYLRQGRIEDAHKAADRAVELDANRADLRALRAQILRAAGDRSEARLEFRRALVLDPASADARSGLSALNDNPRHELRFGFDEDLFSFAPANRDEGVSLVSKWTPHWTTSAAGRSYTRGGASAGNFVGSVTGSLPRWGALTVGGATAHDEGVVPSTEAFFELNHGIRIGEDGWIRGVELIYGQHWYWYSSARILTANETSLFYLPRDWTWLLRFTEARSHFSGTGIDWKPSGLTRLGFPLAKWSARTLSGNIFFAVGTEDFAQVDQIGSFASQTYGGGLRYQLTARQDVTGYAAFQQRTRNQTQQSFGFTYGIRF